MKILMMMMLASLGLGLGFGQEPPQEDTFIATITARVFSSCQMDPDDTEFKFGDSRGGRALREPIKNNGGAACVFKTVSVDPPETEDQIDHVVPGLLLPGATKPGFSGRIEGTLTVQFQTARLFVVDPDVLPHVWQVETVIPEGSLVRGWGKNHYVAEGSSITYRWRPVGLQPQPTFDKWLIEGVEGVPESTENPLTLKAGLGDVKVTPVVIEP
jgi:hypothetical protein